MQITLNINTFFINIQVDEIIYIYNIYYISFRPILEI